MKPGTLVTVFGMHKGVVVSEGKVKPSNPDMVRVEYRDSSTGMRVAAFVPKEEVKERT